MSEDVVSFRLDTSDIQHRLDSIMVQNALLVYSETVAKEFESYAKANRKWTDRTGHARQRLTGYVEKLEGNKGFRICIAHGVDYGLWLELAHEKKYAILEPTVRIKTNEVLLGLKQIFR